MSVREIDKYTPAYQPLSTKPPSEAEKRVNEVLLKFVNSTILQESEEESQKRKDVLVEIRTIFLQFVRTIALRKMICGEDELEDHMVADLFVSGSHRLGVRDIGADIDTVCIAPHFVEREDFFKELKQSLLSHGDVSHLNAVEDAFVPVMEFEFRGVAIDLLFARLGDTNQHPMLSDGKTLDVMNDSILLGVDEPTMVSLNGPRVTNMIVQLVQNSYEEFLVVLRCVRRWAKKRGLYGNKMGYLGGVNCNILVAFICQLTPRACPYQLLQRFFSQYKNWKWPEPIQLNNILHLGIGSWDEKVWSAQTSADIMPLITPAYPAMNSTYNVNVHTKHVMLDEFKRGFEVMTELLRDQWKSPEHWGRLFEPSDFFIKYSHYLACHIVGNDIGSQSQAWIGFVEAKLRYLTLFLQELPLLIPIHLHPVVSATSKSAHSVCYFIGFHIDYEKMRESGTNELFIDRVVAHFVDGLWDPKRGFNKGQKIESLDFFVDHLSWKKLPREVFEIFGGYEQAKQRRKAMQYDVRPEAPVTAAAAATSTGATAADATTPSAVTVAPANTTVAASSSSITTATAAAVDSVKGAAAEVLTPLERAKRELLEIASNAQPSHVEEPQRSHASLADVRQQMVKAAMRSAVEVVVDEISGKKPRLESDALSMPDNYYLPNVTWQLLDTR